MTKTTTTDRFALNAGLDYDEAEGILRPLMQYRDTEEE